MNTKLVMGASALFLGTIGLVCTFLPQEILSASGIVSIGIAPLFLQILGALYVSYAMLNWMSKENSIGGIYNRPIAMGNVIHFTMAALALIKGFRAVQFSGWYTALTALYIAFAVLFGLILFTHPLKKNVV